MKRFIVFENVEKLADFASDRWRKLCRESVNKRGRFVAAISGGKTPVLFYEKLREPGKDLSWDKTHIFLTDERNVPPSDPDSNYGMIKKIFPDDVDIKHVPINRNPRISAENYEKTLAKFFNLKKKEIPVFDLILLGIGEDGHTASLFPGEKALHEKRLIASCAKDGVNHERITLTLPVINNARKVIFLITGRNKADITRRVIEGATGLLPASLVMPGNGKLLFLIDNEAARLLETEKKNIKFP